MFNKGFIIKLGYFDNGKIINVNKTTYLSE